MIIFKDWYSGKENGVKKDGQCYMLLCYYSKDFQISVTGEASSIKQEESSQDSRNSNHEWSPF